ncbi:hypothetical protein EC988_009970, partial [Linderina pennispora]
KPARLFVYKRAEKAGLPRHAETVGSEADEETTTSEAAAGGVDTTNEGEPELLISF